MTRRGFLRALGLVPAAGAMATNWPDGKAADAAFCSAQIKSLTASANFYIRSRPKNIVNELHVLGEALDVLGNRSDSKDVFKNPILAFIDDASVEQALSNTDEYYGVELSSSVKADDYRVIRHGGPSFDCRVVSQPNPTTTGERIAMAPLAGANRLSRPHEGVHSLDLAGANASPFSSPSAGV